MHPELSGRENVRLYGKIMGLSRRDIERRFDDIVEFAGVGAAIDRQVKQYSSGMQLRLGFSVAAHLNPEWSTRRYLSATLGFGSNASSG